MKLDVLQDGLGYIALEDSYGGDLSIVNAARVSYDHHSDELTARDEGLLRYLMRDHHGTPFEANSFRVRVRAPIFVYREWHRHRIGISINEQSARYVTLDRLFFVPDASDVRERVGKPGNYQYQPVDSERAETARADLARTNDAAFDTYERLLADGIAPEIARTCLPVATYSSMVWTANLRSALAFCALRSAPTAQREIQRYSLSLERILEHLFPVSMAAWNEFGRVAP